jgi:hypothetical protein
MTTAYVLVDTVDWNGAGYCTLGDPGGGVLGSTIPSSGQDGPGIVFPWLDAGDLTKRVIGKVTSWPAGLNLFVYDDTSFRASAALDGNYVAYVQLYLDLVAVGSPQPVTFTFGSTGVRLSWTEGADTFAAAGVHLGASIAWVEGTDTFAISGEVHSASIASIEGPDTFALVATQTQVGALAWTEGADTFAAVGAFFPQPVLAISVQEGADTFAGTCRIDIELEINPNNLYVGAPRIRLNSGKLPKD